MQKKATVKNWLFGIGEQMLGSGVFLAVLIVLIRIIGLILHNYTSVPLDEEAMSFICGPAGISAVGVLGIGGFLLMCVGEDERTEDPEDGES